MAEFKLSPFRTTRIVQNVFEQQVAVVSSAS